MVELRVTGLTLAPLVFGCGFSPGIYRDRVDSGADAAEQDAQVDDAAMSVVDTHLACTGNDLVLCAPFDGNLVDGSPSMNQISGTLIAYEAGVSGMAVRVGATSVVTVVEDDSTDPLAITMETWVKPDAAGGGYLLDNDNQYSLRVAGTSLSCLVVGQTSAFPSASGGSVPADVWTHVACTYSAATGLRIYVNGTLAGTDSSDGALRDLGTTGIAIGRDNPTGTNFHGVIDELRIWSVVREASEICPSC